MSRWRQSAPPLSLDPAIGPETDMTQVWPMREKESWRLWKGCWGGQGRIGEEGGVLMASAHWMEPKRGCW
jgi:hypothetical protein